MKGKFSIAAAILASRSNHHAADAFSARPLSRVASSLSSSSSSSSPSSKMTASSSSSPSSPLRSSSSSLSGADHHHDMSKSLVADTIASMGNDPERIELDERIARLGIVGVTREERARRRRALDELGVPDFMGFVSSDRRDLDDDVDGGPVRDGRLRRSSPSILQLNIGLYCNQACNHCHVESSPLRTSETMSPDVAARCLALLRDSPESVDTLDLTGGAPELNGQFRLLVSMARAWSIESGRDLTIIDRCNLTALVEPGQEDLVGFLRDNRVSVVASLPCYGEDNVDAQRGRGVFRRSVEALGRLNDAGYGSPDSPDLRLDLVYNPGGPFLPPSQAKLEVDYKGELMEKFGIRFNSLLTITNMPIKRFADYLAREGKMREYMELLVNNYNRRTVKGLMCLNTVSVGWDGMLYDCDFNQQLGMGIVGKGGRMSEDGEIGGGGGGGAVVEGGEERGGQRRKLSVFDIESLADLGEYSVRTDNHCFGCTAGSG
jgi:radical SAM/Cys-rich protein